MPSISRSTAWLVVCASAAWLVGCGDKPVAPTAPSAAVTALAISAPPASLKPGESVQLTATATLSSGQTANAASTVAWNSSDSSVATVSSGGLVTAKSDGRVTIRASVLAITSSVDLVVRRGGRTLKGVVTESAPTTSVMVAGARVTVVDGLYAGVSATTDAGGAFTLDDVDGTVNVTIAAPLFDDSQVTVDTAAASNITVRLLPTARTVTDENAFSVPWGDRQQRYQSTMTFDMHRAGRAEVATQGSVGAGESSPLCSELRDDNDRLLWENKIYWLGPASATLQLEGGRRYTLKISDCGWAGRPILNYSRLTATHPY